MDWAGWGIVSRCRRLPFVFVRDQWGDPGLVPAGDDGLMSHRKTIRNCQWENTSRRSIVSALILHFLEQNIYILCAESRPFWIYDTFMSLANWSKTTTDVNLILGGFDDGMSGMKSIFLNGVCTLGVLIKNISHKTAPIRQTTFTWGGTDALGGCSHPEFNTLAWRLDSCKTPNRLINCLCSNVTPSC